MRLAVAVGITALAASACANESTIETDGTGCFALPTVVFEDRNPGLDKTQLDYLMNVASSRAECLRDIESDLAIQTDDEVIAQRALFSAEASSAEAAVARLKIWNPSWTRRSTPTLKP